MLTLAATTQAQQIERLISENYGLIKRFVLRYRDSIDDGECESEAQYTLFVVAKKWVEEDMEGSFPGYAFTTIQSRLNNYFNRTKCSKTPIFSLDVAVKPSLSWSNDDIALKEYIAVEDTNLDRVEEMEALRDFYEQCTEEEKILIDFKVLLYYSGVKLTQKEICLEIHKKHNIQMSQGYFCKRLAKLNKKYALFVNTF